MDENIGFLKKHKMFVKGGKCPFITGTINAGGIEYDIAIWGPKEGKVTFCAKLTPKEEVAAEQGQSQQQQQQSTTKIVAPPKQQINPTSLFK